MTDLAVAIVTWNNADVIADALQSLIDDLRDSGLEYEIWLVDSASKDDTVRVVSEGFAEVKLIACEENIGFGASNNLALRRIGFVAGARPDELPKAVYLLNPDTVTRPGASRQLHDSLMAGADVGMVGARLSYADGSFQHSAFRFPDLRQIWTEFFPTPGRLVDGRFNGRYPRSWYAAGQPFEVDFTLGATMMLKRDVIRQTYGFDEDFFMYCEEVDWAWRIKRRGWRILCVPAAHVIHLGGGSTSQARPLSLINLWKSRLLLYDKYYPRWKRGAARQLLITGMQRQMRRLGANDGELESACRRIIEMAKS
ncbi:MAG: glycosyltransferase family 2 protein [Chloroflexi bacterium]|nr:glycosyltransferase family 2 protein [Chloroflexota bacterium]